MKTRLINEPDNYELLMHHWTFAHPVKNSTQTIDFAHVFIKTVQELQHWLPILKEQLATDGMIWVSWLKKASGIASDVGESDIRKLAISLGLVDIKVCAVSELWSGLKLVIPRDRRV